MSPRSTFQSCGSSSSWAARRRRPTRVVEPLLGAAAQRSELEHLEDAPVSADALAAVEQRPSVGREQGKRDQRD